MRNTGKNRFKNDTLSSIKQYVQIVEEKNRNLEEINEMLIQRISDMSGEYESKIKEYSDKIQEIEFLRKEYRSAIEQYKTITSTYKQKMDSITKSIHA